jgi:hypothetical protein
MSTRTELVAAIRERYQRSNRTGRTTILDEFVAVTGYPPQARGPTADIGG